MTCELAVMNCRGIALAADSAVTLGDGAKIYNTAEKLFSIAGDLPVGVMTFGAADLMGVPWETIVKIYARRLGDRRFDTLEEYASNLLSFVESSTKLFPSDKQRDYVMRDVYYVWTGYRRQFEDKIGDRDVPHERAFVELNEIIAGDHEYFKKYGDRFGDAYANEIQKAYREEIDTLEKEVFEGFALPRNTQALLRKTITYMFSKKWVLPGTATNIVIAGMGEDEPFPALIEYAVGGYALEKLRWVERNRACVGAESDGWVIPFAQRDTAETIINGVHPHFNDWLSREVDALLEDHPKAPAALKKRIAAMNDRAAHFFREHFEQPLMQTVGGLPRRDLAKMAEVLVSVTAFVMRMSYDQQETVSEPVDVAILSKGDGFTWVKRKGLIDRAVS